MLGGLYQRKKMGWGVKFWEDFRSKAEGGDDPPRATDARGTGSAQEILQLLFHTSLSYSVPLTNIARSCARYRVEGPSMRL